MISRGGIIWCVLALVSAVGAFTVKYQVHKLENRIAAIDDRISSTEEAIHVLKAEWSYLNRPERLAALAKRYLDMAPMKTKQIASISQIPLRQAPAVGAPTGQGGSTLVKYKVGQP